MGTLGKPVSVVNGSDNISCSVDLAAREGRDGAHISHTPAPPAPPSPEAADAEPLSPVGGGAAHMPVDACPFGHTKQLASHCQIHPVQNTLFRTKRCH